MVEYTKRELIILFIVMAVVVSLTTAALTLAVVNDLPKNIAQVMTGENGEQIRVVSEDERVIEVVKNVSPAVVSIVATRDLPQLRECTQDEIFRYFFPQLCGNSRNGTRQEVGAGSGFIVREDGLVATNKHVVEDENADYTVILNDGKRLSARVLVRDPLQDVALLDVDERGLPSLTIGNSDKLQPGQSVIAIGNALGEFQNTVSVGVVSGLRRTVVASGEELRAVIQTDAAINPGNSGGPLLNLQGEVVGINTAVAAGAENIGFALPINIVQKDIQQYEKSGKIIYPFLGVQFQMVDAALKESRSLPVDEGALLVAPPTARSAAERAELREGDIIIEFGGERVTRQNPLGELIQKRSVGDRVALKYVRGRDEKTVEVTLEER